MIDQQQRSDSVLATGKAPWEALRSNPMDQLSSATSLETRATRRAGLISTPHNRGSAKPLFHQGFSVSPVPAILVKTSLQPSWPQRSPVPHAIRSTRTPTTFSLLAGTF